MNILYFFGLSTDTVLASSSKSETYLNRTGKKFQDLFQEEMMRSVCIDSIKKRKIK
jgi:hypothetical protein